MKQSLLASLSMLVTTALLSFGQAITGDLTVNITDPSGGSINAAKLELISTQGNATIAGQSNEGGSCTFSQLKPGSYKLRVTAPGFQNQEIKDINVQLAQRASVGVKLTLGTSNQIVEVSANAETLLNSESATTGQVLQEHAIQDLPLNGRNFIQLAQLSAGAAPIGSGNSPATAWTGRADQTISIQGLRESNVSYLVNGIETRNARFGNAGIRPNPDAIQEFNVQRGFFTPDYGGSAAIINTTLRSGTNDLHLIAFDLIRNKAFDANNYFANSAGQPLPAFSQNQFGATASGPVVIPKVFNGRNKLFFLFNYEGFRQREGLNLTGLYPSAQQYSGNLADNSSGTGLFPTNSSYCLANPASQHCVNIVNPTTGQAYPGNVIPASQLNPITQTAIRYAPVPNVLAGGISPLLPSFNTFASPKRVSDFDQYNVRMDYQLSSKDSIYGTFSNADEPLYIPALQFLGGKSNPLTDRLWTATYVRTLTPTIVNEFRFGYNNTSTYQLAEGAGGTNYAADVFGLRNTSTNPFDFGVPQFNLTGYSSIGSISQAIGADETNYQYVDNLSISRGKHNFKVGFQIMHLQYSQITDFNGLPNFSFTGQFSGSPISDFLLGTPFQAATSVGDSSQNMVSNYYGGYLSDNWHILPKLTLNLGLRYEFSRYPREINGRAQFFNTATGTTVVAGQGVRPEIVDPDFNNFAPRVGLAYQITRNTVIRTGAGIYYSTDNANELQFEIVGAPFYSTQTLTSNVSRPTISLNNLFPAAGVGTAFNPFTLNLRNRTPYVSQWTFGLQHTLGSNHFIELGYVGSTSQKLPQRYNYGAGTIDPTGTIPIEQRQNFPQFGGVILFSDNRGWSNYQALTARYEHRLKSGLYILGAYTWQKSLDLGGTDDFTTTSTDFKKFDRGHSSYDVPHRFVASFTYELPFGRGKALLGGSSRPLDLLIGGWRVNGIGTLSTGQFRTISTAVFWPNINPTFNTSVPNVVGNPLQNQDARNLWFNSSAFAYPTQRIQGNAGRNQFQIPGVANWDMSLFKDTRITERLAAQLRFEAFNVFNHTQFGAPNTTWGSPNFGRITSTLNNSRRLQLGLRLTF